MWFILNHVIVTQCTRGQLHDHPSMCVSIETHQVLPTSSSSQMITFTFSNGGVATLRTSGTEPKIKYYTELCAAPGNR